MLAKGQKINERYEIVKSIGEGGMANVYLANDTILDRKVAIKVLRGDLSGDEKFIRRFQREAMSASNLSHPNIVEVYDIGEEDNNHYIVMEHIEGRNLKQLIYKRGALTLPEVIDIMSQLADGIAHAHDAYIIHRDIKPQNILIMDNGLVKITDFGIAVAMNATQLTQTNSVMGSVHYLPPEQANGKSPTIKSDVYSLGILMYELLTGSVPFKGDNAVEIAIKHMKEKIPSIRKVNPIIPQSVENIILKACAKNPKNRYDDVREMYRDLITCMDHPDQKRYVYPYAETDLDETKVLNELPKNLKIEEKKEEEIATKIPLEKEEEEDPLLENEDIVLEEELEPEDYVPVKEKKSKKRLWILAIVFVSMLILLGIGFVVLQGLTSVPNVKIPDVSGLTIPQAEEKLRAKGFEVELETKKQASDKIKEGLVVDTSPQIGRTVKKGTTITIVESKGEDSYTMEDLNGKNYIEVKAILESVHELYVLVEKKSVANVDDYRDKADIIIDYTPSKETKLVKGDTVTLYIPDIVEEYPDFVADGWSVDDIQAFCNKYNIKLAPPEYKETSDYMPGTVISQNKPAKTVIIKGTELKIVVAKAPSDPLDTILP